MKKIAIIGSGLSGLILAHQLQDIAEVIVFEKARGVGGRLATRYAGEFEFDHGAQYFTVESQAFHDFIQPLQEHGVVEPWNARFIEFEGVDICQRKQWSQRQPHYVAVPKMNAIAKYLAVDIKVELKIKIDKLIPQENLWMLQDDALQLHGPFDWVLSTAPWPQTKHLFPKNIEFTLAPMQACYALMLGFNKPLHLDWDVASIKNTCLGWISVNSTKPGRQDSQSLVVLSSNDWADAHLDADKEWVISQMLKELHHYVHLSPMYVELHCWRYAKSSNLTEEHIYLNKALHLGACGDWSIGGRVECAYLAGMQLAKQLTELIVE